MRMILGILVPDGGRITWNGAQIHDGSRRHFGYLPEERGIYGKMKVREQIAYFGKLHGLREPDLSKRVDRWIERLGLSVYADRPCGELSKGNQQKVQVACAAVHAPQLLVLDEPFSGLDPVNADVLLAVLERSAQQWDDADSLEPSDVAARRVVLALLHHRRRGKSRRRNARRVAFRVADTRRARRAAK